MMSLANFLLNHKLKEMKQKELQEKFNLIFPILINSPNSIEYQKKLDKEESKRKENK